jgi:hypothetical protein
MYVTEEHFGVMNNINRLHSAKLIWNVLLFKVGSFLKWGYVCCCVNIIYSEWPTHRRNLFNLKYIFNTAIVGYIINIQRWQL